jgi:hypothetical protein
MRNKSSRLAILLFVLATGTLLVLSARAQQLTPLPHVRITIPVNPPPGWVPKQWADLRAHCQEIADDAAADRPIPRSEWSLTEVCGSLGTTPPPPPKGYPPPPASF